MNYERLVTDSAKHLNAIYPTLSRTLANLEEWGGLGYSGGSGIGKSTDVSDPTFAAANAGLTARERDAYATDHAKLTEALVTAENALRMAREIVEDSKVVPVDPVTKKPKVAPAEGCYPCSQVREPITQKLHENGWQKRYSTRPRPSNPQGPGVAYCSWHDHFIETYGVEPATPIVRWHLDHPGRENKVPRQLIQDHHPEQWALAQSKRAGRTLGRQNLGLRTA